MSLPATRFAAGPVPGRPQLRALDPAPARSAAFHCQPHVDDFAAVLAEAARVLTPGGVLVFYGAHPCFNGPHVQWMDDGGVLAHSTYRQAGWHQESPWWGMYVRRRVGMRHHPLAELLNAFITTELIIEHVAGFGGRPVPTILAIRARKRGPQG
jgi:SAM-dependent methyltransferase